MGKDQSNPSGSDPSESRPFIRETVINERPRIPFWKKLLMTLLLALVFGTVAAVSFYFTRHYLPEETSASSTPYSGIVFSTDEDPARMTTAAPTEAPPTSESEPETGEVDEIDARIAAALNSHSLEIRDYRRLYSILGSLTGSVSKSLVTVTSTNAEQDWFQTEITFDSQTFGVVVGITEQEILILAPAAATALLSESSSLTVTFPNSTSAGAYTKGTDSHSGLAVLAVPVGNVAEATLNNISAITLGNSFTCYTGQPIIALGAPSGYLRSVRYGILSYVETGRSLMDNTVRILHTDISGDENAAGFLINSDGNLVGWIDPDHLSGGCISAIGISDLKSYLENLTFGLSIGYLGIEGMTVTLSIAQALNLEESGGVYITALEEDSPALNAGLQSGDIILSISDQAVKDMETLRSCMLNINTEQIVRVTVLRRSGSRYQELTYDVRIERR